MATLGVGGANCNFRSAQNFSLNDPDYFQGNKLTHTDRSIVDELGRLNLKESKSLQNTQAPISRALSRNNNVFIYTTEKGKEVHSVDMNDPS
mgnify:CR=1 FL=1